MDKPLSPRFEGIFVLNRGLHIESLGGEIGDPGFYLLQSKSMPYRLLKVGLNQFHGVKRKDKVSCDEQDDKNSGKEKHFFILSPPRLQLPYSHPE